MVQADLHVKIFVHMSNGPAVRMLPDRHTDTWLIQLPRQLTWEVIKVELTLYLGSEMWNCNQCLVISYKKWQWRFLNPRILLRHCIVEIDGKIIIAVV